MAIHEKALELTGRTPTAGCRSLDIPRRRRTSCCSRPPARSSPPRIRWSSTHSGWTGVEPRVDDGYRVFDFSLSALQFVGRGNANTDWLTRIGRLDEAIYTSGIDPARNSGARYRPDIPPELHQTAWCANRAIEQKRGGPWLMSVNIFDPHGLFDAPRSYQQRYLDKDLPPAVYGQHDEETQERLRGTFFQQYSGAPGDKQLRQKASYYGMIELIDEQVGRMLEALSRTGQRDNTVVIFMSDHGEMLGDHGLTAKGCRFYEGAVRVPLIVSWPGRFRQGVVADGLVELTDMAPTLAELTGEPLAWTNGRSLLPILTGDADPARHHDYVRCEYYDALNMYLPQEPGRHTPCWATMYRDERHKLVTYHGLDHGELYDLQSDPQDVNNLWEEPSGAVRRRPARQPHPTELRRHGSRLRPRPRPDRPLPNRSVWPSGGAGQVIG